MILLDESIVIFVASIPSNVTDVVMEGIKFVPVIVTGVPKWPLVGEMEVIVGDGGIPEI